ANPQEAELLEEATRSMVQKIVKLPVLQLKEACKRGQEEENIIDNADHFLFLSTLTSFFQLQYR
ncbi:MAG: hypothetical protein AAFV78_13770, partial [Bacteroidota bacterium]